MQQILTKVHSGTKTNTDNLCKWYKDFTIEENTKIIDTLRGQRPIIDGHAFKKGVFDTNLIYETLKTLDITNLIKYEQTPRDKRVVIRSKRKTLAKNQHGKMELCYLHFVVSLIDNVVVTVYFRNQRDSFAFPKKGNYTKNLIISF